MNLEMEKMEEYQDIKLAAYEANMQLPELGLVLFTFGNASALDREKRGIRYKTKWRSVC